MPDGAVIITDNAGAALSAVPGLRQRAEEMLRGILETAREVDSCQPASIDPDMWLRLHIGGSIVWYTLDLLNGVATIRAVREVSDAA